MLFNKYVCTFTDENFYFVIPLPSQLILRGVCNVTEK